MVGKEIINELDQRRGLEETKLHERRTYDGRDRENDAEKSRQRELKEEDD